MATGMKKEIHCFLCEGTIKDYEIVISFGRGTTLFSDFLRFHTDCFEDQGVFFADLCHNSGLNDSIIFVRSYPDDNSIRYHCCGSNSRRMNRSNFLSIFGPLILEQIAVSLDIPLSG